MVDRRDLASWLQGPGAVRGEAPAGDYKGRRLGLPEQGPGRIASFGLRLGAFAVDSVLCALIAWGLTRDTAWTTPIFALEVLLLTATAGSSAGQRLVGLQVVRLDRRPVGLWRAVVRTALLLLLVPALIWDRDGRGLHDKAAGTVLVSKR
ncbi:MAG TPA: RDD family protein [Actinomycetes bacterium]